MDEFEIDWDFASFTAAAVYTGENRLVRVQGSGIAPSTGFQASIDVALVFVPNPARVFLEIREVAPPVGNDTLTPISVEGEFDAPEGTTEVEILNLGVIQISEMT